MNLHTDIDLLDSKLSPNQKAEMSWFRETPILTPINADINLGIERKQLDKDMEQLIAYGHPIYLIDLYRHPKIKTHRTEAYIYCASEDINRIVQSLKDQATWSKLNNVA